MAKNMFTEIDKLPFGKEPNRKTKPTEEEVFKEFEALGYEVKGWEYGITLCKNKKFFKESINVITIRIDHYLKCYTVLLGITECITLQEHQLLTKLFKAWGWFE